MSITQRAVLLAGAAALGAGALFAASAWRAVSLPQVTAELPAPPDAAAAPTSQPRLDAAALELVAEHDPFRPERAPAPLPYRMPGDPRPEEPAPPPEPPPEPPAVQVLGTVVMGDGGGIALIRSEGEQQPRFMRVGDAVMGFRLTTVHRNGAELTRGEQVVQLAVADPRMTPPAPSEDRDDRRRRGREEQAERLTVEFMQVRESLLQQQQQLMRQRAGGQGGLILRDSAGTVRGRVGGAVLIRPRPDTSGVAEPTGAGR
ncbi:MAG: hypothetical protein WEB88_11795 [Gemmatimonadota bacterium]